MGVIDDFFGGRMKCIFALLAVLLLAGCGGGSGQQGETNATTPQDALTRLTVAAGYDIAGIPQYKDGRWTSNVRVPGCGTNVTVASHEAPETALPTFFAVLKVGDVALATIHPDADANNMTAADLAALDGMQARLACE